MIDLYNILVFLSLCCYCRIFVVFDKTLLSTHDHQVEELLVVPTEKDIEVCYDMWFFSFFSLFN